MMRCWDTIARTHHRKMNPQWQRGLWLWRVWREIWGELWWELGPQFLQHQDMEPAGDVSKWLACLTPPGHPGTQTTWSLTRFQWTRIGQWRWWEAVARQTLAIGRMVWLNEQWKVCSFTVHCCDLLTLRGECFSTMPNGNGGQWQTEFALENQPLLPWLQQV